MKAFAITIRHPGMAPLRYQGIFASQWAAIEHAMAQTAGKACGITAREIA